MRRPVGHHQSSILDQPLDKGCLPAPAFTKREARAKNPYMPTFPARPRALHGPAAPLSRGFLPSISTPRSFTRNRSALAADPLRCSAKEHRIMTLQERIQKYLDRCEPAVSGTHGHDATFRVTCALIHGFGLDPETAFGLLKDFYNPRCEPPWSDTELGHKVRDA